MNLFGRYKHVNNNTIYMQVYRVDRVTSKCSYLSVNWFTYPGKSYLRGDYIRIKHSDLHRWKEIT